MNINTVRKLPKNIGVAFSGGIDSSVLLNICLAKNLNVTLLTYDHQTETSEEEISFAKKMSQKYDVQLFVGRTSETINAGDSKERFWSECRNSWFHSLDYPIATGHNLNDAVEWYLMTALTGNGGYYVEYSNKKVVRPLLLTERQAIEDYAKFHDVEHIVDPTNADSNFNKRNMVRNNLLPYVKQINPGIFNTVKKNIIRKEFHSVV
jgi:tRNA(Ile)-lysidine synthase